MRYIPEFKEDSLDWHPCFTMNRDCIVAGLEKNINPQSRHHGIYFDREIEADLYVQFRRTRSTANVLYRVRTER